MTGSFLARVAMILAISFSLAACTREDWQPLPSGTVTRIAFGSCTKQWKPQPIWNTVASTKPDLFLFLGDAIYADWHGDKGIKVTAETLKSDWDKFAAIPEFAAFRRQVPFMATWDNHDYGTHNGGAEFTLKEVSKSLFLDFFGEPEDSVRRRTPGIYYARILGPEGKRVQVIMLDTRYFRGPFKVDPRSRKELWAVGKAGNYLPNDDETVTLLGETQWRWLEQQLRKPAELRLIVSSTQVIADEKGVDEWGVFPLERKRLFNLISTTGATGVLFLSGNVHFSEISKTNGPGYTLYDFTSSGMTHVSPYYASARNSRRVVGPFVEHSIGLLEIDWEAPDPVIQLKALGLDNRVGFNARLTLGDLKPKKPGPRG